MKIRPYTRIVIEGMDGSGKTTLVNQLMEHFGDTAHLVPGYNRYPNPKPPMDRWWMEQLGSHPLGKIIVHDRFFYPEFVYGPILRGRIQAEDSTVEYVQKFLREHAFLIYCRPPVEVLKEGIDVEPQMEGVKNMFNDLLSAYDRMIIDEAPHYDGRFVKYDWSDDQAMAKLFMRLTGYIWQ